jgi:DNA-binding cell septation regulator SpoVG
MSSTKDFNKIAKMMLERWAADLIDKDKSMKSVQSNFDELFYELWTASVPFDIAHELIDQVVKSHMPSQSIAKRVFMSCKKNKDDSFQDFMDNWKETIKQKAVQAFFTFYTVEGEEAKKEEKKGSMSGQEYSRQRKYADAFPTLDVEELKERMDKVVKEKAMEVDFIVGGENE